MSYQILQLAHFALQLQEHCIHVIFAGLGLGRPACKAARQHAEGLPCPWWRGPSTWRTQHMPHGESGGGTAPCSACITGVLEQRWLPGLALAATSAAPHIPHAFGAHPCEVDVWLLLPRLPLLLLAPLVLLSPPYCRTKSSYALVLLV